MGFTVYGGELMPEIELTISGALPVSDEEVQRNIQSANGLGLPTYREVKAGLRKLAVVGGGPSVSEHVEKLRAWDGDIWAINGAWAWLQAHEIDSTFIACDPHPIVCTWAHGVKKAILETRCNPEVFEMLKDAEVTLFDLGAEPGQVRCGSSTVTAVPHLAVRMGYQHITIFGCESSYNLKSTHAYFKEDRPEQLLIECGGVEYLTAPDFYMQAVELYRYIKEVPEFIAEESGGLLRAFLENECKFSIRWVSQSLAENMKTEMKKDAVFV